MEKRVGWRVLDEVWTDGQLRNFLLQKLRGWSALSFVVGTIDAHPEMTFEECKALLMLTVDRLENSSFVQTTQAREMAARVNPLYIQQAELQEGGRYSSSSTSSTNEVDAGYTLSNSMDQLYCAAVNTRACYNCHEKGHLAVQCPALWCYHCKMHWSSERQQRYQHN